jgi:methoxymalonate biosynthesis acyl carrier protein
MDDVNIKIRAFLSRFFRTDGLADKDDIFALGLVNSLFAAQLVSWVEEEFDIRVEDEDLDIENFNTINAIASFAERKGARVES